MRRALRVQICFSRWSPEAVHDGTHDASTQHGGQANTSGPFPTGANCQVSDTDTKGHFSLVLSAHLVSIWTSGLTLGAPHVWKLRPCKTFPACPRPESIYTIHLLKCEASQSLGKSCGVHMNMVPETIKALATMENDKRAFSGTTCAGAVTFLCKKHFLKDSPVSSYTPC